jgi:hypothetical protein
LTLAAKEKPMNRKMKQQSKSIVEQKKEQEEYLLGIAFKG